MPVMVALTRTIWPSGGARVKGGKTTIWTPSERHWVAFANMRRSRADDEALPPADGSSVAAGQAGFPFGPVAAGGVDEPAPWEAPTAVDGGLPAPPWDAPAAAPAPPWASSAVPTDVPALDDVLDGTTDVAGTFRDKDHKTRRKKQSRRTSRSRKPSGADPVVGAAPAATHAAPPDAPASDARLSGTPAPDAPDAAPDPAPSRRSRSSRRPATRRGGEPAGGAAVVQDVTTRARSAAISLPRRKATGLFARRPTLFVATGVALVAGIGAAAGVDLIRGDAQGSSDVATAAVVSPEVCASAQVAWSRAASAQVQMDAESPKSLRTGFVGARDNLSKVDPPGAVITDWATVLTYVTAAADAAQAAEDDEVEEAVAGALQEHDTEAMTAASQRITEYLGADCAASAVPDAP